MEPASEVCPPRSWTRDGLGASIRRVEGHEVIHEYDDDDAEGYGDDADSIQY